MNLPIPSAASILELVKKGYTLEAQEQIMELRAAALALQEENLTLREELKKLREQADIAKSLSFDGTAYWRDVSGTKEGPFCSRCYDEKQLLVRLHDGRKYIGGTKWLCLVCSTPFD